MFLFFKKKLVISIFLKKNNIMLTFLFLFQKKKLDYKDLEKKNKEMGGQQDLDPR